MSKNPLTHLSRKVRDFVEAYAGDEVSAMLAAGYQGAPGYLKAKAEELLADPLIQEAIKARSRMKAKTLNIIADREERQALLTSWMRNEDPFHKEEKDANGIPIPQGNLSETMRLKSLELLGKSEGDFVDKIEHSGNLTFSELVTKSYQVEESIEDIEAEYNLIKEKQAEQKSLPAATLGEFL